LNVNKNLTAQTGDFELIDTHAHLYDKFFKRDTPEVVERAKNGGIVKIISVAYDMRSSYGCVKMAQKFDMIMATVGVHPHNAVQAPAGYLDELRELARNKLVVAVGEMGLDYYRNLSPKDEQQKKFREQLALGRELELPVIIHDREAHEDVLDILKRDGVGPAGGVIHCFSGDWEMAQELMRMGFYLSVAGTVTYPKSTRLKSIAAKIPAGRLLVETDSPHLTPEPFRGKRNEPLYVRYAAKHIAELRGIPFNELALLTTENARRLFRLTF